MKKYLFIFLVCCQSAAWANKPIEQGIRLFNQSEYQQAEQIFQQQSENGSAYATFWLGVAQYKNSQHFEAGETFLHAAEMGDPWAMGLLGRANLYANNPCDYLGWPCDNKWLSKSIEGWKKLAEQGDGKAEFALEINIRKWWEYIPFYRQFRYKEIVGRAIQNGGYNFLDYNTYWDSYDEKIIFLKQVANRGYAPAMIPLYYDQIALGDIEEAMDWINKAIVLGYAKAARTLYYTYSQGETDSTGKVIIHPDPMKAYYYNAISGALGGEKEEDTRITEKMLIKGNPPVTDENGRPVFKILITNKQQKELDKQAADFVKNIKPNKFLDETSIDLF